MFKPMIRNALLLYVMLYAGVSLASAQGFSAYIGFGGAHDSSNNQTLDSLGDVGPTLNGAFGTFGADYMWKSYLGFGGEYSWRLSQGFYAPMEDVKYRPDFYDFNAVIHPLPKGSRVVPEFQGGIGGSSTKFYESASGCALSVTACSTVNEYLTSSNHFQVHFSAGVRLYLKGNVYVRPQLDVHYVNNFVEFGSDWVPEYTISLGYTFGEH